MGKKLFFIVLVFTFFLLTNRYPLNAGNIQNPEQQEDQDYSVTVSLKLIQVFVTDENGRPVQNLTKSDFILLDNGKLQRITDFEKHELVKKALIPEEETTLELLSRMNRKFLILLDILGNDNVGVIQSKEAALHFIDTQLQPGDEVGIISYAPLTGLNINTYFTTDHDKIKEAIKNAREVSPTKWEGPTMEQVKAASEKDAIDKNTSLGQKSNEAGIGEGFGGESSTTSMFIRPFRDPGLSKIKKNPIELVMEVVELSKILRYIPGIKHILFFSGGGPQQFHSYYERLGMELAGANCLVHTINALGTRANLMGWNRPSQETLEKLASASGGKYYKNVQDYEVIAEDIQNLSGNYYVLGYYIDEKWDGRYHKIQVNVKQEGYRVHAQGGYFNPKPFSRLSEFEKKLHLIDLALSDRPYFQDPIDIPLITLPCSNSPQSNCILLSRLPTGFFEGKPGQMIEIINIVCDGEKNIVTSRRGEIDYSELLDEGIYQYAILSLPPGQYECRAALRNLVTGKGAFGLSKVTIPPERESGLFLFPPLLLIPEQSSRFLKLSPEKEKKKDLEDISLNQVYPFLSNRHSPLINTLGKKTTRIMAVVRYAIADSNRPEIELRATLFNETTGEKESLDFLIITSKKLEAADVILAEIALPELEPGRYAIEFSAKENVTGLRSFAASSFTVE